MLAQLLFTLSLLFGFGSTGWFCCLTVVMGTSCFCVFNVLPGYFVGLAVVLLWVVCLIMLLLELLASRVLGWLFAGFIALIWRYILISLIVLVLMWSIGYELLLHFELICMFYWLVFRLIVYVQLLVSLTSLCCLFQLGSLFHVR